MRLIIDIPEAMKNRLCFGVTFPKDIQTVCEALNDGTPIPDNATNGDVMKAMFPNVNLSSLNNDYVYIENLDSYIVHEFFKNWWYSPYQKGGKE